MQNVVIADDRPLWVQEEDKLMACMTLCSDYKRCASRMGADCKKLGGSEIPKINSGGYHYARKNRSIQAWSS
ncbi:hypothetical protein WV34_03095 [Bacillus amyloliquefaciens]|nr:hypothetical protein WV34_03095 [Bacillus amyloliquefaciens]